ncbi:MAG: polysaccharide biosynthesis C-terminal domain-containing protein, partial [Bacilli bacterium]
NILAMVHKVNVNLLISIITGISNIVLDVYLIQVWGSIGAAFATMFVVLLSSGLSAMYLFKYLNSNEREGN